ncbi:unnamed protein product [Phytomonas sp. Hart1]|nr:unnamed protein product [Phytomonas sp. Hart1]|eukprot:CCW69811.1 unnamed protein product [Phytomonas sp. isolate Hart1]
MTSSSFAYVQGNERLDWGVLVAIDLQRLTKDTNVDTLQRVVENLAFSHITRDEAAMFSPEHIQHLFKLTQIVIQYLVFSQECLGKLNARLNNHVGELRGAVDALEKTNTKLLDDQEVLKKEVKAQRRTLLAYEYTAAGTSKGKNHPDTRRTSGTLHSSPPQATFVCSTCGEAYHKVESLQSHVRKRHGTALPKAGVANATTGGETSTADALRHEAELKRMQDRIENLERQLEKERDAASGQQHDKMMQLLIQQISNLKSSSRENAANSQQPSALSPPLATMPGVASPTTSVMVRPEPNTPRTPPTTHGNVLSRTGESLSTIPVVPDLAAMTEYNLSRQRQTEHATLVRQIHDLEKELRDLKQVAHEKVEVEPKPIPILTTSSPPSEGHKLTPVKTSLGSQEPPVSTSPLKPPIVKPDIVNTIPIMPPAEIHKKLPTSLPIVPPPHTTTVVQAPYTTIPKPPSAVSTTPTQPNIPIPTPKQDHTPILKWMPDAQPQTPAAAADSQAPWRQKEYSISLSSSTSTSLTARPNDPPRKSAGVDMAPVLDPATSTSYSFLSSATGVKPTPVRVPLPTTPTTEGTAIPIPTPAMPVMPGQPAYAAARGATTGAIAVTPNPHPPTLSALCQRLDSSDSDDSSS